MAVVEQFIRCKNIIASAKEYINDIQELKTADPRLVVFDMLTYMGLTDDMIRDAVGDDVFTKATESAMLEVRDGHHN